MDLGLAQRVYVMTGASRGLGYATAECLVADGARVVISSPNEQHVKEATRRLNDLVPGGAGPAGSAAGGPGGGESAPAIGVAGDLADPDLPQRLVDTAMSAFGRLDGALISVGGPPRGTPTNITDVQWRESFETVFLGAVRLARTVAGSLQPGGAIGFVLSTSAKVPVPDLGISNALRPGLAGTAKDMADEWGPRGIRVVSLLPGRILTDRNRELFEATGDSETARAQATAAIPLRRLGEPAEFGRVAAFLLSPAAGYLSGLTVPVDGGATRAI